MIYKVYNDHWTLIYCGKDLGEVLALVVPTIANGNGLRVEVEPAHE